MYQYASEQGFNTYKAPDDEILYVGDREAEPEEYREFGKQMKHTEGAISSAGRRGKDVSPASVVPNAHDWKNTIDFMMGPFEMAKDMTDFSCQDWWESEDGGDGYCSEGLGTVVMHRTRNIDVELNTPVSQIDWGNNGIVVHTSRGPIKARNCIVAVSTGVLANGRIKFSPALSAEKEESFLQVSMGYYNPFALQFEHNFLGIGADGYLAYKIPPNRSHPVAALGVLTNLYGSNPFFDGADASAKPAAYKYRAILRESVDRKIYFAGEACHKTQWATVHGAYN